MNLGIVTTWFERGAAYVSRQFRDTLVKQHNVFIYARSGGDKHPIPAPDWSAPWVTVAKEPKQTFLTAIDKDDFFRWIEENRIDIVLFNEQRWWWPVLWCHQRGLKVGSYVDYYTEETVEFFNLYDFLICNTLRHYSVFDWHPQCYYIPWGTDINLFYPAEKNSNVKTPLTFFHSAGMNPYRKGTDLVIEAYSHLLQSSRLIIHTQVDLEKVLPKQGPLIRKLQGENRLDVIEKTVPAPGLYHLGDVYVYPSRLDGIGLSLVEASACGLPLIATDSPPMNEFVSEENGRLVTVEKYVPRHDGYYWPQAVASVQGIYEAMSYYLENSDHLPLYKSAARRYAEEFLNWEKNSAELCKILEDVELHHSSQMQLPEALVEHLETHKNPPHKYQTNNFGLLNRVLTFIKKNG